ncbi:unnamed protein product [Rhodiola kirilowii]
MEGLIVTTLDTYLLTRTNLTKLHSALICLSNLQRNLKKDILVRPTSLPSKESLFTQFHRQAYTRLSSPFQLRDSLPICQVFEFLCFE